jgi:hypothetical protein
VTRRDGLNVWDSDHELSLNRQVVTKSNSKCIGQKVWVHGGRRGAANDGDDKPNEAIAGDHSIRVSLPALAPYVASDSWVSCRRAKSCANYLATRLSDPRHSAPR